MSAKAKGTRNEHRSIAILEAAGYACTRAAASLGAWDIIGIGSSDVVLLQVKTRDWPGAVEMETLQFVRRAVQCSQAGAQVAESPTAARCEGVMKLKLQDTFPEFGNESYVERQNLTMLLTARSRSVGVPGDHKHMTVITAITGGKRCS